MATPWDIRPNEPIVSSSITIVGGDANAWQAIDDDPDSPDLSNYIYDSGSTNGELIIGMSDTPADFVSMDSPMTVRAITESVGFTDDSDTLTVQITDSSGTALTDSVTLSTQADTTQALRTATLTLNATGSAANKATWDAARLRMLWTYGQNMGKDNGSIRVYALEVESTYTEGVVAPSRTGSASSSLPAMSQSGTGDAGLPTYSATAVSQITSLQQSSTATSESPSYRTYRSFPSSVVSNTGSVADPWENTTGVLGYTTGGTNRALLISRATGILGGTSNTKSGVLVVGFDLPALVDPTGLRAIFNLTVGRTNSSGSIAYTLEVSTDGGSSWQTVFDRPAGAGHGYRTYSMDLSEHIPVGMTAADVLVRINATVVSGTGDGALAAVDWFWSYVQVADSGANHVYPVPTDYPLGREGESSPVYGYGHSWMNTGGYETAGNHFLEQFATHFGGAHTNRAESGTTSVEMANAIKGMGTHWDVTNDGASETISVDEGIAVIASALNDNNYTADLRVNTVKDQLKAALAALRASARITHDATATPVDLLGITAYWSYTGTWNNDTGSAPSGMNGYHLSGDAAATATFTFDSSSEVCVIVSGWAVGIAGLAPIDVYFDNVYQYTINTEDYFVAAEQQTGNAISATIPLSFRGLDSTVQHTVRVEHAGVGGDQISIEGAYVTTPADVAKQPVIVLFEGYPSDTAIAVYNNADVDATRATFDNYAAYVQEAIREMGGTGSNIWLVDIRPTVDFQINPTYFGGDELHLTDAGMNAVAEILTGSATSDTFTGVVQSPLPSLAQAADGSTSPPAGQPGYSTGYTSGYGVSSATQHNGTADSSLPGLEQNIAATSTVPTDTGTTGSILPSISQSANATSTVPEDIGVTGSTLPTLEQQAQGTTVVPSDVGAAGSILPALAQSATGSTIEPEDIGTINTTLPALDQLAEGSTSAPVDTGTIGSTLPSLQQASEGSTSQPADTGSANSTLPTLSQSITASSTPPEDTATIGSALPNLGQQASGNTSVPTYGAIAESTLPLLTQSASGKGIRLASVAISGAGQVSSATQKVSDDSVSISGAGTISITASAEESVSVAVSVSTAGAVVTQATKSISSAASVSGSGSLTLKTVEISPRSAIVKGAGTTSVHASKSTNGAASVTGTGSVVPAYAATEAASGAIAVTGSGAVSTGGRKIALGASSVSSGGTISITSTANESADGISVISGAGTVSVEHSKSTAGTSIVSGSGTVRTTHISTEMGSASTFVTGRGTIEAIGSKSTAGSSTVSAGDSIQTTGSKVASDSVTLSTASAMNASGLKSASTDVTTTARGTVEVVSASSESASHAVAISGGGSTAVQTYKHANAEVPISDGGSLNIASTASESVSTDVSISGAGQVGTTHTKSASGASIVSGSGLVNVQPISTESGAGNTFVTARGTVNIAATKSTPSTSAVSSAGSIGTEGLKQAFTSIPLSGSGTTSVVSELSESASGMASVSGGGLIHIVATAQETIPGSTTVSGGGDVLATGSKVAHGSAQIGGNGSTDVLGIKIAKLDNAVTGTDSSDVAFASSKFHTIQISGAGTIQIASSNASASSITVSGTGTQNVNASKISHSVTQLSTPSKLSVVAHPTHLSAVYVSGTGSVEAGRPIHADGTSTVSGDGSIEPDTFTVRLLDNVVSGSGVISLNRKRVGRLLPTMWIGRDRRATISNKGRTIQPSIIIE